MTEPSPPLDPPIAGANERTTKILTTKEYLRIAALVANYKGLPVDCETMLLEKFPHIHQKTLESILQNELVHNISTAPEAYEAMAKEFMKQFESDPYLEDPSFILNMALRNGLAPGSLCRAIIKNKLKKAHTTEVSRHLKYPHLLMDDRLEVMVRQVLMSDTQEGPWIDLQHRIVGEEYEYRMQQYAKAYGLPYMDENALRAQGFDKTPDMKLEVPVLYKGTAITWIESKATFGDKKIHQVYNSSQYNSYVNRFGAGIVIYWFGYQKILEDRDVSSTGVIVLDDFPHASDLVFLNLDPKKPPLPLLKDSPKLESSDQADC